MTNEKQLTEWIEEALCGYMPRHEAIWIAKKVGKYMKDKMEKENEQKRTEHRV